MRAKWAAIAAGATLVSILSASSAPAQVQPQPPSDEAAAPLAQSQLDQLLAPIALYPDELLGQILMAAGYPLEVVEADRWLADANNAALRGDDLTAALEQQSWDPSVKSLVPFPEVLHMMDGQLDWTESVGEAFIANSGAVMDSIQRLRRQAWAAGKLRSNAEETVTDQNGVITIEPANAQTVYVPDYEPAVVYGPWPYPEYPPYYFPDYFENCVFDDFGYCWYPIPLILPLWGWDRWDWGGHRLDIDRGRFTGLNGGHPPIGGEVWEHDPAHRLDVPYQEPAVRAQFEGGSAEIEELHNSRGYPAGSVSRVPPTMESYGHGDVVRTEADRGASSRASTPSYQPRSSGGFSGRTGGRR